MTQEAIQHQIEVLRRVQATLKTTEDKRQFLIDAGIIKAKAAPEKAAPEKTAPKKKKATKRKKS